MFQKIVCMSLRQYITYQSRFQTKNIIMATANETKSRIWPGFARSPEKLTSYLPYNCI